MCQSQSNDHNCGGEERRREAGVADAPRRLPRNAADLKALCAGYANCAPGPEARLPQSLRKQLAAGRLLA
jgi:hypothetical protein